MSRPGTSSGQRPGTGGRPGTGNVALNPISRPGTGSRQLLGSSAGRPLTGARLGTGQVPSTPGQTAGYGISLNTEVKVSDRPVTQQGMMGMRVGTAGPGRQVQDASYFIGRLHSKTAEITSELEKLQKEIEQDAKDKAQFTQLQRKYEVVNDEVRDLEGKLADYNLAMDKLRSATNPKEIAQVQEQLHAFNQREAEEIDRIFILRQEQEKQVRKMEEEMNSIHLQHQSTINQLAPQKLQQYRHFLEKHNQTEHEIETRTIELNQLAQAIEQRESELSRDHIREEYDFLEKTIQKLRKQLSEVEAEAKTVTMDPNEARTLLLAKVKDDKAKLEELETVAEKCAQEQNTLKNTLNELKADMNEREGGSNENGAGSDKYEKLFQRDSEVTAFLDAFPEKKQQVLSQQRQSQSMIVKLLEHISEGMSKENKLSPSITPSQLEEMKSDLTFKERQLESSMTTKERLTSELAKRRDELEKVNSLDDKIALELSSLREKIESMNHDMQEFEKIDTLEETHLQTKQYLQRMKQQYTRRRDAMRQQTTSLNATLENLRHEISSLDVSKTLEGLEQKLRHHEQNIFHIREFLDAKSREVNYEHIKQDCLKILTDFNLLKIKQMQSNTRTL